LLRKRKHLAKPFKNLSKLKIWVTSKNIPTS
jgi:hypothetical protein